jgi:hypothetical protein
MALSRIVTDTLIVVPNAQNPVLATRNEVFALSSDIEGAKFFL